MIDHHILPAHHLILDIIHGEVPPEELQSLISGLLQMPHNGLPMMGLSVICDNARIHTDAHTVLQAGLVMQKVAFRDITGGKLAMVSFSDLGFAFSRMYQSSIENPSKDEVQVFRGERLKEAIAWLGLSTIEAELLQTISPLQANIQHS